MPLKKEAETLAERDPDLPMVQYFLVKLITEGDCPFGLRFLALVSIDGVGMVALFLLGSGFSKQLVIFSSSHKHLLDGSNIETVL